MCLKIKEIKLYILDININNFIREGYSGKGLNQDQYALIGKGKLILDNLNKPESLIKYVKDRPGHDYRYSLDSRKIRKMAGLRI